MVFTFRFEIFQHYTQTLMISVNDFSKVFEAFFKDLILQDISKNIDSHKYGKKRKGKGKEPAVLQTMVDWKAAFDLQASSFRLLISYLSYRKMKAKFNG